MHSRLYCRVLGAIGGAGAPYEAPREAALGAAPPLTRDSFMAKTKPLPARAHKGLPLVFFAKQADFAVWLAKSHASAPDGIWIQFAKKGSGVTSITYEEAREVAIRFGWIDGLKNALDATYYTLRFTPRRGRSKWSQINRDIAEGLIAGGAMAPAGLAEVDAAKADGRWEAAYPSSKTSEEPEDFLRALAASPEAKAFYPTISRANRFAILYRIHDAKQPVTREKRIRELVLMLARGETVH